MTAHSTLSRSSRLHGWTRDAPQAKCWVVRDPSQWLPEEAGGIEHCAELLSGSCPFVYFTLDGEEPELYKPPFAQMESFQLEANAAAPELAKLTQFACVRAIEFKRGNAAWRVRVFAEQSPETGGGLEGWAAKAESCLRPGSCRITCHQTANSTQVKRLTNCAKTGLPAEARQVLGEIAAAGGTPDRYAWSALVSAHAKLGEIDQMRKVVHEMASLNIQPNDHAFNGMVAAFGRLAQPDQIRDLFAQMSSLDMSINKYCYTSLLSAYAKLGQVLEAEKVLEEMKKQGVQPTEVTYNSLVSAYTVCGMMGAAADTVKQMQAQGLQPDQFTFTSLMTGHTKNRMTHLALDVLNQMEQDGINPDHVAISAATKARNMGAASASQTSCDSVAHKSERKKRAVQQPWKVQGSGSVRTREWGKHRGKASSKCPGIRADA